MVIPLYGKWDSFFNGYFHVMSQEVASDGKIHLLKINALDFSDYLDYADLAETFGGRSICVAGGYLWTAEEHGGDGEKLYRRSLTTLVADWSSTPLGAGVPPIDSIVTDGTYIYCFGVLCR